MTHPSSKIGQLLLSHTCLDSHLLPYGDAVDGESLEPPELQEHDRQGDNQEPPEPQDHDSQGTSRTEPEVPSSLPDLVYGQQGWAVGQWAQWPAILSGMSPEERSEALSKRQPGVDGSVAQEHRLPLDQQEALDNPGNILSSLTL